MRIRIEHGLVGKDGFEATFSEDGRPMLRARKDGHVVEMIFESSEESRATACAIIGADYYIAIQRAASSAAVVDPTGETVRALHVVKGGGG